MGMMKTVARSRLFGLLALALLLAGCLRAPGSSPAPPNSAPATVREASPAPEQDSTPAQAPIALETVGQTGGPIQAVALQGDIAYFGAGLRLVLLDVSDPSAPRELGATEPFGWYVEGVAVAGEIVLAATGSAGVQILDVSDPSHPRRIGKYDTPGYAEGVAVMGRYAYVADGPSGFLILDLTDPARPREAAALYIDRYVYDVALAGRYAYLAGAGAGLLGLDL